MTTSHATPPKTASFYRYADLQPDLTAVVAPEGTRVGYGELHARANRVSHALRAAGIEAGDRVALVAGNGIRYFEVVLGCAQIGVTHVPVNHHFVADEIAYVVENSGSRLVFADEPRLDRVRAALDATGLPAEARVALDEGPGFRAYADFLDNAPQTPPSDRLHAPVMLYTSGTTGRPKGISWPPSTMDPEVAGAASDPIMALRGAVHDPGAVTVVAGPLYHGTPGSWGLQGLHHGHTVVLMDRWDSEGFLRTVEEYRATTAQLAPIHFHRLLALPAEVRERYDVSSLRIVSHAGAATPVDVKQRMMDWFGPVLWEYYAASEGFGTSISPEEWLTRPGSVGRHDANGATMEVRDEQGAVLPVGETGALWIRNPGGVLTEYLGDPEKTAASRSGEFYTAGDHAYLDADGYVYIVDRRTDMILSGGVNIYPAEIENALRTHSSVADVAVVGAPDPEWGQRVHAIVVPAPGTEPGPELEAALRAHAEVALARYKLPRDLEFRASLPYSDTGKLLRRTLRAELWPEPTDGGVKRAGRSPSS